MTGNDVLLLDNAKNQAFDAIQIVGGIVNPKSAIPTELKTTDTNNPMRILSETGDTAIQAMGVTLPNGKPLTGIQIFFSAPNMTAADVASFANNGPLLRIGGGSPSKK